MEEAVHGAGYTLKEVQLEITGRTERAHCEVCEQDRLQLVVDGTGQRFDLDGDVPIGRRFRVTAKASGWVQAHPRLSPLEFVDP